MTEIPTLVLDISRRSEPEDSLPEHANMADVNEQTEEERIENQMEIKMEPTLREYEEEGHENSCPRYDGGNAIPSSADIGASNLWTSKATACLISQYKRYYSMVGQSSHIRSLREMFEMISMEMQKYGFYFSPQKCENKWRVLERKYKNLVFRERLKKPGRMRHYGQWEHKRALDEIFKEKKKHMYLMESDFPPPSGSGRYMYILPTPATNEERKSGYVEQQQRQQEDPLVEQSPNCSTSNKEQSVSEDATLPTGLQQFLTDMAAQFTLVEKNKERRHKEKMELRKNELDVQRRLLKLKEQKMELQKCQIIAAAQHLHLNM